MFKLHFAETQAFIRWTEDIKYARIKFRKSTVSGTEIPGKRRFIRKTAGSVFRNSDVRVGSDRVSRKLL